MNSIINDTAARMDKSIISLKAELVKLRTGRAHPGLLEHIKVHYYNVETPLNQVANIAIENARTLTVTPWDKSTLSAIEKAILSADLGLNPVTSGTVIRVPLPLLTEERRKELARVVREEAEKTRVTLRQLRREANNALKELLKTKKMSEDEERKAEAAMQKLTDAHVAEVDTIASKKEADLMTL